ncbi:MAG: signal peptide peptidase SppA [Taibaiella sp.]|nr:signal peptide peptidase SppA [Taibaiella sp.]
MKEFFRSFFASLLAIMVSGVLLVGFFFVLIAAVAKSVTEKDNRTVTGDILVLDVTKRIHEIGETNPLAAFSEGQSYKAGLYDITNAIAYAKDDDDIKGIYIKLGATPNGWATLQELQYALLDFRESGKFIYAYGEKITQGAYFAATAADSIFLNPVGDIELKGFATVLSFFKGTLDKLEVEPEIFYAGKFKSATEPFRTDKMSEPNRLQIRAFQEDMWQEFVTAAAEYMGVGADTVDRLARSGAIQFPSDAVKYGVIDGTMYADEVETLLKRRTNRKQKDDLKMVSINEYCDAVKGLNNTGTDRIAVLLAEGDIVDGEQDNDWQIASRTIREEIRKLRDNDKVKAVVLRVNSPGGSALASEVILRELKLLHERKPLIVSMGNYAASGGYYISTAADSIFAMPNTITGSIGVFGMLFNVGSMMKNKLGVTFDEEKNAPFADFPTAFRPLTPEEGQLMQRSIDTIYNTFKGHVAEGRRLSPEMVDSIAQGRVWTGTSALRIGLVDGLGGLDRAIGSAADIAKLTSYRVVTYPQPVDKLSTLMKRFNNNAEAKAAIQAAMREELGAGYEWLDKLRSLQAMNGRAMMAMPFVLSVQ